ncbi:hypothetical protein MLD38_033161 [Melastoma candidum]|uniref:Uncharacterized protein n=1 Tax=Melastoma candidum TaxID=119954 RepID=A0ACB9M9K5_9MYRT|nr:hypothetical protein MLD38_033161 [Melastoma candidum]
MFLGGSPACCRSPVSEKMRRQLAHTTSLRRKVANAEQLSESGKDAESRADAATKLQTVYRSFRTRRQLADCAVLVEQKWWKLLDFAELKRSSISFFDIEKPETAISRWLRARTRAAKVGKGLSNDAKARKLALQHWLEAIDPRHRYGHNLQFYYAVWLHCVSKQPFFYWLDIGEGKEVSIDRCPRWKLHQQCIKYLGPKERMEYEVIIKEGKFFYKQSENILDTRGGPEDVKWIFVLSTVNTLYVGQKLKGKFQHSSFLAGGATLSAGRLEVEDGILKAVLPHSGHYQPTEENFEKFLSFLKMNKVDISEIKRCNTDEEELAKLGNVLPLYQSETDLANYSEQLSTARVEDDNGEDPPNVAEGEESLSTWSRRMGSKLTKLEIPRRTNGSDLIGDIAIRHGDEDPLTPSGSEDGYATAEESFLTEEVFMFRKMNLDDDDDDDDMELKQRLSISKEKILQRIDSHKSMRSYQLAYQLSSKWTTGAGPRIGCLRDYPPELGSRVLEQANLSPRGVVGNQSSQQLPRHSPAGSSSSICRDTMTGRSRFSQELVALFPAAAATP